MIAARCCGAMARLIEEATEFAKTRVVSGEVIANYQLIQAMLADSVVDLQAARLMTYEAAAALGFDAACRKAGPAAICAKTSPSASCGKSASTASGKELRKSSA